MASNIERIAECVGGCGAKFSLSGSLPVLPNGTYVCDDCANEKPRYVKIRGRIARVFGE